MSTGLQPAQQQGGNKLLTISIPAAARIEMLKSIGGTQQEAERFLNNALVSFQTPAIRACTPQSQLNVLFQLCALGLLPNLQQAALIVRTDWDKHISEVTCMPQWQGFQALMLRYPDQTGVLDVEAKLVHVADMFDWDADANRLTHTFDPLDENREIRDEDDIRGGYLKITYRGQRPPKYHFVTKAQIVKARSCSTPSKKTGKREVWEKWFAEQALKTIYRNAYSRRAVPVDPIAARHIEAVIAHEDALLENDPNRAESPAQELPAPQSKSDRLPAALLPPQPIVTETEDDESLPVSSAPAQDDLDAIGPDTVYQDGVDTCCVSDTPVDADSSAHAAVGSQDIPSATAADKMMGQDNIIDQYQDVVNRLANIAECHEFLKTDVPRASASLRTPLAKMVGDRMTQIRDGRGTRTNKNTTSR
jgi:recombinational DNA repair protein RecT